MKMKRSNPLTYGAPFGLAIAIFMCSCTSEPKGSTPADMLDKRTLSSFSQEIQSTVQTFSIEAGGAKTLDLTVRNSGTENWLSGVGPLDIDVGYRWLDSTNTVLPIEGKRGLLTRPVIRPGESDSVKLQVLAPSKPGSYVLWVSMVQEGVAWFFSRGAKPLILRATITT